MIVKHLSLAQMSRLHSWYHAKLEIGLYSTFELKENRPANAYCLFRTFLEKPSLALHFRSATVWANNNLFPGWNDITWNSTEELEIGLRDLTLVLRSWYNTHQESISNRVLRLLERDGHLNVITALTISQMVNLNILNIKLDPRINYERRPGRDATTIFDMLPFLKFRGDIDVTVGPEYEMDKVHFLHYDNPNFRGLIDNTMLWKLLAIRNLHSLQVYFAWSGNITGPQIEQPKFMHLKRLVMHHSLFSHRDLLGILMSTPNLTELSVHLYYWAIDEDLYYDDFSDALSLIKDTIEKLEVEMFVDTLGLNEGHTVWFGWIPAHLPRTEAIWLTRSSGQRVDLSTYPRLTHLRFPMILLADNLEGMVDLSTMLPAGLQSFQHTDTCDWRGTMLRSWQRENSEQAIKEYYALRGWPWVQYWGHNSDILSNQPHAQTQGSVIFPDSNDQDMESQLENRNDELDDEGNMVDNRPRHEVVDENSSSGRDSAGDDDEWV